VSDPRSAVIGKRLSGIGHVVAFLSAKGGVGKTFCAVCSSLALARAGRRVGILDLDFQGASAHIFLGIQPHLPEEEEGILPLDGPEGVRFMSVAAFTGERALPLRGEETSDAILELFAVVRWGQLDYLLIDMPPGIGEEALDIARLVPRLEALVVSTTSLVSISVVERLLTLLKEVHVPVTGILANMVRGDGRSVADMAARHGVPFAGDVPFDPEVERAIGSSGQLAGLAASAALDRALAAAGYR